MKLIASFDPTEGYGAYPTAWALKYPHFCVERLDGTREDGSLRDPIRSFAYPEVLLGGNNTSAATSLILFVTRVYCFRNAKEGWPIIPRSAVMPAFVDVETVAREKLVDALAF